MIEFNSLDIGYRKPVLKNINGTIGPSSIYFLLGPNGSGKSSLLKTLGKIIPTLSGSISYSGSEHTRTPVYLSSDIFFQSGLVGSDILDLYDYKKSKWYGEDLLQLFDVQDILSTPLEQLSSGERQRLFLLGALSHPSDFVLLDEPLNHLDWNFSLKLQKIILLHSSRGRSFVISNHDLNWLSQFTNHQTQTWVLYNQSIHLKNSTELVLNDIKLQSIFKIKTRIIFDEKTGQKLIHISEI